MKIKRGDIYWADLCNTKDHVQCFRRPVLIVSNNKNNCYSNVVMVCPITSSKTKSKIPTHVVINIDKNKESTVLCEQIMSIDTCRLIRIVGMLSEQSMTQVDTALRVALGME